MYQESAESLTADLDMNYGEPYQHTPARMSPSVSASCLSLDQTGPIPGVSLAGDARFPRSERTTRAGSASPPSLT